MKFTRPRCRQLGWPFLVGDNRQYWKFDFKRAPPPAKKFDPAKHITQFHYKHRHQGTATRRKGIY